MRTALILAAGQSRRMQSSRAKVVHPVGGRPMIEHVVSTVRAAGLERVIVVVGHRANDVRDVLGDEVEYVVQAQQRGTGHAVLQAASALDAEGGVLVVNGDTPLLLAETLAELITQHEIRRPAATLLTAKVDNPTGYGRIERQADGKVVRIVEESDAGPAQKAIDEINTGIGCYATDHLLAALAQVQPDNVQGEYYLVDVIPLMLAAGQRVEALQSFYSEQFLNVNDRKTQAQAEAVLRQRTLNRIMEAGVTIIDPATTYIDSTVTIGQDSTILPFSYLAGETVIGSDCIIGPGAVIRDSQVAAASSIEQSNVQESQIGEGCQIGPYSHLRPGTILGAGVKVGNFAEIKNSTVGPGSKASHHSYIGDSHLGRAVNIGAGAVTVNYDGSHKHETYIGDEAFIGCNVNMIAPVQIGPGSYVAAGSTVNQDVPGDALAIARQRQENKDGWVERRRQKLAQRQEKEQPSAGAQ